MADSNQNQPNFGTVSQHHEKLKSDYIFEKNKILLNKVKSQDLVKSVFLVEDNSNKFERVLPIEY